MHRLIYKAWQLYESSEAESWLVRPSMPILFFGDLDSYRRSQLRVITVGLNPSLAEFPDDKFQRFERARHIYPDILRGRYYDEYLAALNDYFRCQPYNWFDSFEPILNGMDSGFYDGHPNVALHTDLCSLLATDPTWSDLPADTRSSLEKSGNALWHGLVESLSPDVILISVALRHLDRIKFRRLAEPDTICAVERKNPYNVTFIRIAANSGKPMLIAFGPAAQKPFGKVSNVDKQRLGSCILAYLKGVESDGGVGLTDS